MTVLIEGIAILLAAGFAFYAERQAQKARDAAARAGIAVVRARQAADGAERAAYGRPVSRDTRPR